MIVVLENTTALVINLKTEKVADILEYDFTDIIGLFFLNSQYLHSYNSEPEEIKFAFLFSTKIHFFKMVHNPNESAVQVLNFKLRNVLNYYFNLNFLVLVIERGDKKFDFYNLSHEKLNKPYTYEYPLKNVKRMSSIGKFFNMFSSGSTQRKSDEGINIRMSLDIFEKSKTVTKESIYKKTQFFLENM